MIPKFIRTITSVLPVDQTRKGECNNCGECCQLPFKCTFLKAGADGKNYCAAYNFRPLNCRKFPRTNAQLAPVSDACGFTFDQVKESQPALFLVKKMKLKLGSIKAKIMGNKKHGFA